MVSTREGWRATLSILLHTTKRGLTILNLDFRRIEQRGAKFNDASLEYSRND